MRANKSAFTLIEALVVVAIIAILSIYFFVNLRPDTMEQIRMDTTRLAADIRYVRNMVETRATYNGTYPASGYGIVFINGDGATIKSQYKLYAGNQTNVLKTVVLSSVAFRLIDPNNLPYRVDDRSEKKIVFMTENNIESNLQASPDGDYQIEIYYPYDIEGWQYYFKSRINIGRKSGDDFLWSNLAITYDTTRPICGNGFIEPGETCEPVDENGVPNPNCRLDCKINQCGDGYLMGTEQCERTVGLVDNIPQECRYLWGDWCYMCSSLGNNCLDINSNPISCCPEYVGSPSCVHCQILTFNCKDISRLNCVPLNQ